MGDKLDTFGASKLWRRSLASGTPGDLKILSHHLWGFLNICVHGEAKDVLGQANMLDGLNAWRLIVYDLRNSNWVRISDLRQATKNVSQVSKLMVWLLFFATEAFSSMFCSMSNPLLQKESPFALSGSNLSGVIPSPARENILCGTSQLFSSS